MERIGGASVIKKNQDGTVTIVAYDRNMNEHRYHFASPLVACEWADSLFRRKSFLMGDSIAKDVIRWGLYKEKCIKPGWHGWAG